MREALQADAEPTAEPREAVLMEPAKMSARQVPGLVDGGFGVGAEVEEMLHK